MGIMIPIARAAADTYRGTMPRSEISNLSSPELTACIEASISCSTVCKAWVDVCLAQEVVGNLAQCVLASLECVDICHATWQLLMHPGEPNWRLLNKQVARCQAACRRCREACALHADMHEHCRVCALSARRCEEACARLLTPQY